MQCNIILVTMTIFFYMVPPTVGNTIKITPPNASYSAAVCSEHYKNSFLLITSRIQYF